MLAKKCFFTSPQLEGYYSKQFYLKNTSFKPLPSLLSKANYSSNKISRLFYGGNLYKERVLTLLLFSDIVEKIDNRIVIEVFGFINNDDRQLISKKSNIVYHGIVNYDALIKEMYLADLLIHIEGFSDYYKKDSKYAFSTKISDYYMIGIPFFLYAPKEIVVYDYCYRINKDYVASNEDELKEKLQQVLNGNAKYTVNYEKIKKDFSPFCEMDFELL